MPKEEYLDALTDKMRSWRERLGSDQNPEVGQKYEQVVSDSERDKFFRAEEAKAYGLVDEVFEYPTKSK